MVKLTKIYTRTGDDGTTGLVDGSRIAKNDARMVAIGDVDELNSALGVAVAILSRDDPNVKAGLQRIQNDLFDLGADLATPGDDFAPTQMSLRIIADQTVWLENEIDRVNAALTPLTSFILPGGSHFAAALHVARATARRAERSVVHASLHHQINPEALHYINRLSDLLFVMARFANAGGQRDILWVPGASR